jgi:hypothetical protein
MGRSGVNWDAAADMLGHELESHRRQVNGTTWHHWVTCSCGYESSPGKSKRFAVSAGIGHIRRVAAQTLRDGTSVAPRAAAAGGAGDATQLRSSEAPGDTSSEDTPVPASLPRSVRATG